MAGALALLVAAATIVPSRSQTQAPALEGFAGTFVLSADRRELSSMDDSINRVVDQMNIFIREIARGEVHRRINPEQRIRFALRDERTLALSFDDWGPVEVRVGGGPLRTRGSTGEDVNITVRFGSGRLVQHTGNASGSRTNTFVLSPDQERLHMSVRIASNQLPSDIRYRLTYRRAD